MPILRQLELLGQTGLRTVLLNTKNVAAKGVGLGMTVSLPKHTFLVPLTDMTIPCLTTYTCMSVSRISIAILDHV